MRFRKGGGRENRVILKGKEVEEVKEIKYLGYILKKNGERDAQVRERVRKRAAIMGQVWGIGKRRFGNDWGKRMWLFRALMWSVVCYGAEIWGWKK